MSYRVQLTATAKQDLREIALYIASQAKDKEVARSFVSELRAQCNQLADFPKAGAFPKDHTLCSLGYRFITHKEYLIFYAIDEAEKNVSILAIFHSRKDYFRIMRQFI